MKKIEFLNALSKRLSGLRAEDSLRSLEYYGEMIDDFVEEGKTEEEAVEALGSLDDIVEQILGEISLPSLIRARVTPRRRLAAWEIVLIAVGFPVWGSLLLAAFAVVLSVSVVLLALLLVLYVVTVTFGVCSAACVLLGMFLLLMQEPAKGLFCIGAGLVLGGLAVFGFFAWRPATASVVRCGRVFFKGCKRALLGKEKMR